MSKGRDTLKGRDLVRALVSILILVGLAGCITVAPSERRDLFKEVDELSATNEALTNRISALEEQTDNLLTGMEDLANVMSRIEADTRSSLAESNADLEKLMEEFNFVRGGIEESGFDTERFTEEIESLRTEQEKIAQELDNIKASSAEAVARADVETKASLDALGQKAASLEERLASIDDALIGGVGVGGGSVAPAAATKAAEEQGPQPDPETYLDSRHRLLPGLW